MTCDDSHEDRWRGYASCNCNDGSKTGVQGRDESCDAISIVRQWCKAKIKATRFVNNNLSCNSGITRSLCGATSVQGEDRDVL